MLPKWKARACLLCARSAMSSQAARERWEAVIGVEVHMQIAGNAKLFSGAATAAAPPNAAVAFLDASLPGTLPVLNARCVEAGVRTALALGCRVRRTSHFDRKHYFYSDMPAGYQITQLRRPIATDGRVPFWVFDKQHCPEPYEKELAVSQIQLEQDSGKSLADTANSRVLVDLNRAGIGLLEIVTEPNLSNGVEVASFIRTLILTLTRIGTCNCDLNKGNLRVDANISIRPKGSKELGTRAEVKNLNSMRFLRQAVEHEIERQIHLVESGGSVLQETRGFDFKTKTTESMRDKNDLLDYRFMPEPNLPPLRLKPKEDETSPGLGVELSPSSLPQLPQSQIREWAALGIPVGDALFILEDPELEAFTRAAVARFPAHAVPTAVQLLVYGLRLAADATRTRLADAPMERFAELVERVRGGRLKAAAAQAVCEALLRDPSRTVDEICETENLFSLDSSESMEAYFSSTVKKQMPDLVRAAAGGGKAKLRVLVHRAVKASQGRLESHSFYAFLSRKWDKPWAKKE